MSKLPVNIKQNEYYFEYEGERWIFYGKSQLASDTKAILSMLSIKDQKVDRIVIIATKEACDAAPRKVDNVEVGVYSAVDFYKKEILDFVSLPDPYEHCVAKETVSEKSFIVVNFDGDKTFPEAVSAIKGNGQNNIRLFIDVQGGYRSSNTQINAITELLANQGVEIMGRFANDFAPDGKGPFRIHKVDEEYETYELVTAMEIFKKYGRGEGLINYFKNKENSEFANNLSKAIELAANAIQLCDVDGFDNAIYVIRRLNESYEKEYDNISPLLKIIYDDILKDYAPIIYAKYSYVEQVKWCLSKNFIQQALTIFESKMPDEYVLHGLCYMATNEEKNEVINKLESIYNGYDRKNRYKFKNVNHYFINTYLKFDKNQLSDTIPIHYGNANIKGKIEKNLVDYSKIKSKRNSVNHAHSSNNNNGFFNYMKTKYPSDRTWKSSMVGDVVDEIKKFLDEWVFLADQIPECVVNNVADMR